MGLRMEYGDPACSGNPIHKGADTRGEREGGRHEEEEKGGPGSECECAKYRRRADNRGGRGLRAPSRAPRTHANMNKACSENRFVPDADEPRGVRGCRDNLRDLGAHGLLDRFYEVLGQELPTRVVDGTVGIL